MTVCLITLSSVSFAAPGKIVKASKIASREHRKLIKAKHKDFERCGEAEFERTKRRVKGVVLLRFTVNGDGKVIESGPVHNTTKSRFIADCLVRTIEQIKFPATFGPPVTSSHPFKFDVKK